MPNTGRGNLNTLANKVFVASLVAMPFFGRATAAGASDEAVIRELNAGYVRAFLKSDADWYDRHLTPDFMCILTTGAVVDRATSAIAQGSIIEAIEPPIVGFCISENQKGQKSSSRTRCT